MKLYRILFILFSFCFTSLNSQILEPVEWSFHSEQIEENKYELVFIADIDPNWAIYSKTVDEGGPIATTFYFTESSNYKLIGEVVEDSINMVIQNDLVFDMVVSKFYNQAIFKQKVEVINYDSPITGGFEFMTCDDTQCLAPEIIDFKFNLSNKILESDVKETISINQETLQKNNLILYGFLPTDIKKSKVNCGNSSSNATTLSSPSRTLFNIFGLGFIGGLLALLTPCVFPMIPLTVSFFTKKNDNTNGYSNAILYGVFIVLVYLILSIPFHLLDSVNPDILNDISTNIYLNIFFFKLSPPIIFLLFAFSFFGYYELSLPSSWVDKSAKRESAGGIIGIFFMALTLAIVSFSCTGPILGSLLAGSISNDFLRYCIDSSYLLSL